MLDIRKVFFRPILSLNVPNISPPGRYPSIGAAATVACKPDIKRLNTFSNELCIFNFKILNH